MLRWPVVICGAGALVALVIWQELTLPMRAVLGAPVIGALIALFLWERLAASHRQRIWDERFLSYRRMLSADALTLFWQAAVHGKPHWDEWNGDGATPFRWDLMDPLDREVAEQIVGLGYVEGEFGDLWCRARHPEDKVRSDRLFFTAIREQRGRLTQEFRVTDHRGRLRWFLEDIRITRRGAAVWHCLGVCIDITERKLAEQAATAIEQRMHRLMLQSRCLPFEAYVDATNQWLREPLDPATTVWRYEPLDYAAAQNLLPLALPADEPYRFAHIALHKHPDDTLQAYRAFVDAVQHHLPMYSHEYRCRNRDGQEQWLCETVYVEDAGPLKWHLAGIVQDVTGRRRAERELQSIMRQAACIILHGVLRMGADPSDRSQCFWQGEIADPEAAQRVLSLDIEPGGSYLDGWIKATVPEDLDRVAACLFEAIAQQQDRFELVVRCRDRAGQLQWLRQDMRIELAEPRVYRVVAVCVNITSQKAAEAALSEARRAAEEANAAKSAFLANMSHEIRTPMTAILGYADLLADPELHTDDREAYAGTIRRNGQHLMSIINDILDLSRIESGKLDIEQVPCSPAELAHDVVELIRPAASEKGLALTLKIDHSVPDHILSDPTRLRQILVNLVGNAVKFTDLGGVGLYVGAGQAADGDRHLILGVSDTGIGIAPAHLDQLFRPFGQVGDARSRRAGGTGLGLVISRRLARLLGGDISVQSELGIGSRFTVRVAATPVQVRPHPGLAASPIAATLRGIRILLAEDGADNRKLVSIHLQRLGCRVRAVEDGQKAVDLVMACENTDEAFHVVLMDMHMPVKDGYDATMELRKAGYGKPIVALTAYAMSGDRERCLQAGCDDYLVKPLSIDRLCQVIREQSLRIAATTCGRAALAPHSLPSILPDS